MIIKVCYVINCKFMPGREPHTQQEGTAGVTYTFRAE